MPRDGVEPIAAVQVGLPLPSFPADRKDRPKSSSTRAGPPYLRRRYLFPIISTGHAGKGSNVAVSTFKSVRRHKPRLQFSFGIGHNAESMNPNLEAYSCDRLYPLSY